MSPSTYRKSLAQDDPIKMAASNELETQKQFDAIARRQWLEHPMSIALLAYLAKQRTTFLLRVEEDSASTQKVEDTLKILRNAVRSKLITDIEEYVNTGNAL